MDEEGPKAPTRPAHGDGPCPSCGGTKFEVRNYDWIWMDGDLCCADCGTKIRDWDAG